MNLQPHFSPLHDFLERAGLRCNDDGIWYSSTRGAISYPADGNAACLQIEDNSFWFRHRNRCIVSLVRRFHKGGTFVDIGGGNGYVARGLIAAGVDCVLVEPGQDGAHAALQRGVTTVVCSTIGDANLPPDSMAAAGMFDVLEHIEDEDGALADVSAILKPGAPFFLTVPAYSWLTSVDDRDAGHFRRYTLRRLARVLSQAGFGIRFASYMFAPLPLPVFLSRTVPSLIGLRGRAAGCASAEHRPGGIAALILDRLLEREYGRIEAGQTIPFGTSCVAVAIKK